MPVIILNNQAKGKGLVSLNAMAKFSDFPSMFFIGHKQTKLFSFFPTNQ